MNRTKKSNNEIVNGLAWHDFQFALRRCPRELLALMKLPLYEGEIFVGGGFLRSVVAGEPVNDIDIFVSDPKIAKAIAVELICQRVYHRGHTEVNEEELIAAHRRIHETDNALTLRCFHPVLQIIHRWTFAAGPEVIQSFDFTICSACFWYGCVNNAGEKESDPAWQSACLGSFYPDLAAKRLVYRNPVREEEPGGSMLRVLKYYQKGYRIPLDSLANVITRLACGVKLDRCMIKNSFGHTLDPVQFAKVICGLLREVDPNIDPNHVAHLPAENVNDLDPDADEEIQ